MSNDSEIPHIPTDAEIQEMHARLDAMQRPVIAELGEKWGYGRIIQLCHQLWDEKMVSEYGIHNHYENYILAESEGIRELRAKNGNDS